MYSSLLDEANKQESSILRLVYVAAYKFSVLSHIINRMKRKPFNPLLGETFEFISETNKFKYFAE